ncbi:hypothetical protein [Flagellimonas myxillae]|uniref:hypothetical protein n=1 Tax=Flagellimonas myxillae TaxID=2942214 RepID=UPI00201F4530|nr:hypothetical protein [Muricauda myxillae]MCL6266702.1 hypothetical protein [Muricauda myxillae]
MEFETFLGIRNKFCLEEADVTEGKMMHSPAIHYKRKVFAFFSKQDKMVFKLGRSYPLEQLKVEWAEFNPFKNKGPLNGWYEVGFDNHEKWEELTGIALEKIKTV